MRLKRIAAEADAPATWHRGKKEAERLARRCTGSAAGAALPADGAVVDELLAASLKGLAPANDSSAIPELVAARSPFGDQANRYALDNLKPLAELAGAWGRAFLLPGAASGFSTADQAARLVEDHRHSRRSRFMAWLVR